MCPNICHGQLLERGPLPFGQNSAKKRKPKGPQGICKDLEDMMGVYLGLHKDNL